MTLSESKERATSFPLLIKKSWPAMLTFTAGVLFIALRLWVYDFNPSAVAEIGTRFRDLDPQGTEGYDGQFVLYIAQDLSPGSVAEHLDVPAYRYQRILLSLLAFVLSCGRAEVIPWMLLGINLAIHTAAVFSLQVYLEQTGSRRHYALIYGLWAGVMLTLGADLHEALAYGLVVLGWTNWRRGSRLGGFLLGLAVLAKETTILFWGAAFLEELAGLWKLREGNTRDGLLKQIIQRTVLLVFPGIFFLIWQLWLWTIFGRPGIGSGGAMATEFEWIPYGGMFKLIPYSGYYRSIFALYIPAVVPSLWGLIVSIKKLYAGEISGEVLALFLNSIMIIFLPFSSFREPWAVIRLVTGVVLALVLFSTKYEQKKVLNYAMFLIVYLVMLLKML
ncbi:MAG: hypothetical protein JXA25_01295 [Anaerolineales bacterium]|nr:hypothetical protein [Anaerolineales bacterium]